MLNYILIAMVILYFLFHIVAFISVLKNKYSSKLVIYLTPLNKTHNLDSISEERLRKIKLILYIYIIFDMLLILLIVFILNQEETLVFYLLLLAFSLKDSLFSRYITFIINKETE